MMKGIKTIIQNENGQGLVEYGLILGLVAVAAVTVLLLLGPKVASLFSISEQAIPEWVTEQQSSPSCAGP